MSKNESENGSPRSSGDGVPMETNTSGSVDTVSVVVLLLSAGFGSGELLETDAVTVTTPAVAGKVNCSLNDPDCPGGMSRIAHPARTAFRGRLRR